MKLYKRIQVGKATRYIEHVPAPVIMPEIGQAQVVTLLSALTISMLISVEEQLPPHATLVRRIKKVEEAVKELAQLNAAPLDEHLVEVGVCAWNGAIKAMQEGLSGGAHA